MIWKMTMLMIDFKLHLFIQWVCDFKLTLPDLRKRSRRIFLFFAFGYSLIKLNADILLVGQCRPHPHLRTVQ